MKPVSNIERMRFSTVRLETLEKEGNGVATGFLFNYRFEGKAIPFLVTNKHVIKDAISVTYHFIKKKDDGPWLGEGVHFNDTQSKDTWFFHPNSEIDVCGKPFLPILKHIETQGIEIFYEYIYNDWIPSKSDLEDMDAVEDIHFVGYPIGLYDEKNYTPIVRKGITATPVYQDHDGLAKFLIDASVYPGSSGSPVILNDTTFNMAKKDLKDVETRFFFLGILAEGYCLKENTEIIKKPIPTQLSFKKTEEMIDIGGVFNFETIVELIKDFRTKRGI